MKLALESAILQGRSRSETGSLHAQSPGLLAPWGCLPDLYTWSTHREGCPGATLGQMAWRRHRVLPEPLCPHEDRGDPERRP